MKYSWQIWIIMLFNKDVNGEKITSHKQELIGLPQITKLAS